MPIQWFDEQMSDKLKTVEFAVCKKNDYYELAFAALTVVLEHTMLERHKNVEHSFMLDLETFDHVPKHLLKLKRDIFKSLNEESNDALEFSSFIDMKTSALFAEASHILENMALLIPKEPVTTVSMKRLSLFVKVRANVILVLFLKEGQINGPYTVDTFQPVVECDDDSFDPLYSIKQLKDSLTSLQIKYWDSLSLMFQYQLTENLITLRNNLLQHYDDVHQYLMQQQKAHPSFTLISHWLHLFYRWEERMVIIENTIFSFAMIPNLLAKKRVSNMDSFQSHMNWLEILKGNGMQNYFSDMAYRAEIGCSLIKLRAEFTTLCSEKLHKKVFNEIDSRLERVISMFRLMKSHLDTKVSLLTQKNETVFVTPEPESQPEPEPEPEPELESQPEPEDPKWFQYFAMIVHKLMTLPLVNQLWFPMDEDDLVEEVVEKVDASPAVSDSQSAILEAEAERKSKVITDTRNAFTRTRWEQLRESVWHLKNKMRISHLQAGYHVDSELQSHPLVHAAKRRQHLMRSLRWEEEFLANWHMIVANRHFHEIEIEELPTALDKAKVSYYDISLLRYMQYCHWFGEQDGNEMKKFRRCPEELGMLADAEIYALEAIALQKRMGENIEYGRDRRTNRLRRKLHRSLAFLVHTTLCFIDTKTHFIKDDEFAKEDIVTMKRCLLMYQQNRATLVDIRKEYERSITLLAR